MVIKDDPTLMFTNAGMNQFKDIFLGNQPAPYSRVANSQKCLRVSGKHNDLEEVGRDTYHHTMFEMLGNWSFGDYFKKEAIDWAWEFLTDRMKLDPGRLYATIFEGSHDDKIEKDEEARQGWLNHLTPDRILNGNKKDNFWEMGDSGPCGPCSEIHVDLRNRDEIAKIPAQLLINNGHPQVIEIWNLVFIQFNRKADGKLEPLPSKHVDTGMGFERLCMAVQGKRSNYDTDIFLPLIREIELITGLSYEKSEETDIAMRVVSDHIRAVSFSIADGQLPSNTGAGYVIRRILRRAIRYSFTFLERKEPFLGRLVRVLVDEMGEAYPELARQKELIVSVITEEESSFLKTLQSGIERLDQMISIMVEKKSGILDGAMAFELYDTFGFPLDLTQLMLSEKGLKVDMDGFQSEMARQKERSRQAAEIQTDDWILVSNAEPVGFMGYDHLKLPVRIIKYRRVVAQKKIMFQLVLDQTPFYAESGGQVGDSGTLSNSHESIGILEVRKENNLILHLAGNLPNDVAAEFNAVVDEGSRRSTMRNHTATHLLHQALREVLGNHVEQKGSLVHPDYLRFDFSHFQKPEKDQLERIEAIVNQLIRKNTFLQEFRELPISQARKMNAMALFGEKYGENVRVIRFGDSVELCGGTHVAATGEIGLFTIVSESSIASGIRRIEAVSGVMAEQLVRTQQQVIREIQELLNNPAELLAGIRQMKDENSQLRRSLEELQREQTRQFKTRLIQKAEKHGEITLICERTDALSPEQIKDIAFQLRGETNQLYLVLGTTYGNRPSLSIMISDNLVGLLKLHAGNIVRESAREMQGGGGGQPFFATAGGKDASGIDRAILKAKQALVEKLSDG